MSNSFQLQPYLTKSISEIQTQHISKYRLSAHQLELERRRFFNIDRIERICKHVHWKMLEMSFISSWYFLFMKEYEKNILKILLQKNRLHSNLFNYSLHICRLGNIFINAQSLERKNSFTYMCKIIIIIIIINLICTSVIICCFNTKIWGVKIEICNRDAIPLCMYCISKIYVWY